MKITNIFRIWKRNWLVFKRTWLVSFFWILLEPVMYLGAIGFGLGAFVNTMEGKPYVEFYFPGLLCNTAVLVSYFEGTYGSYTKLVYQKLFQILLVAPLKPREIVVGEILWSATKGFFGVVGVIFVAFFFGLVSTRIVAALPVLFMICVVFACFGLVMTAVAKSYDSFIYSTSGIVVPLSLIGGIYFPIEQLPLPIRWFSYLSPMTHAIHLVRSILDWRFGTVDLFFALGLLTYAIFLPKLVFIFFGRKLDLKV